jgi:NhaA family Na+:H+ antiporter
MTSNHPASLPPVLQRFLDSEASGGLVLMAVALLATIVANSVFATAYFSALHASIGPLSLQHWINDALMALFFLMVGLEIKREMLEGQLSSWDRRLLPGVAAAGGMLVPALIYIAFNRADPLALHGWAIPSATDIAFALGVISLLGTRVPASLKVFLTALAIIDDLGAVIIIALFYTSALSLPDLAGAGFVVALLIGLNRFRVTSLAPYLVLGGVLWVLVFRSGIHATIAGVLLALTIPIGVPEASPLHRLEKWLHLPVAFLIVPVFGFANAGVSFAGVTLSVLAEPLTLGVTAGLVLGKLIGVFGAVLLMVRTGLAELPAEAGWGQTLGVSLLCGIGFTMSLFIGLLAFGDPMLQDRVKFGILLGSSIAGFSGYAVLALTSRGKMKPGLDV